jgi:hypothetical protein
LTVKRIGRGGHATGQTTKDPENNNNNKKKGTKEKKKKEGDLIDIERRRKRTSK